MTQNLMSPSKTSEDLIDDTTTERKESTMQDTTYILPSRPMATEGTRDEKENNQVPITQRL